MEVGFPDTGGRRLFTLRWRPPAGMRRGIVVFVSPFAEELNKSRRLMAQQAHRLALEGFEAVLFDCQGTGDSEGDFADASWEGWRTDLDHVVRGLGVAADGRDLTLIAVRAGALLAAGWLESAGFPRSRLLLWQPAASGAQVLRQFLRLRVVAQKFAGIEESAEALWSRLGAGESIEVAGYELSPRLAREVTQVDLSRWRPPAGMRIDWLDIGSGRRDSPLPVSARVIESWRMAGARVAYQWLEAEPFWATQEIASPTAVIDATTGVLLAA